MSDAATVEEPKKAKPVASKAPVAPASAAPWTIEVEAYRKGTYPQPDSICPWLRQPGHRFKIERASHFSREWMKIPGCREGHLIDDQGRPLDKQGSPMLVDGHGPELVIGDDVPQTTASRIVKDPLQLLNEDALAAHEKQLTTRGR